MGRKNKNTNTMIASRSQPRVFVADAACETSTGQGCTEFTCPHGRERKPGLGPSPVSQGVKLGQQPWQPRAWPHRAGPHGNGRQGQEDRHSEHYLESTHGEAEPRNRRRSLPPTRQNHVRLSVLALDDGAGATRRRGPRCRQSGVPWRHVFCERQWGQTTRAERP